MLGAVVLHAPVLSYDLLKPLKRPIDGGRGWFGANKTWRGALVMFTGVLLATGVVWELMPDDIQDESWLVVGALIGAGTVLGELPNSFLKRQLDIPPGGQRRDAVGIAISLADQADFAVTSLALLRPLWRWSARDAAEILAVVTAVHVPLNVVGYAIGARRSLV